MINQALSLVNPCNVLRVFSRSTCIMDRKYPLTEPNYQWQSGKQPDIPQKNNIWQVVEHSLSDPNHAIIPILLIKDVAGLGEIGEVRKVHRQRFWRYLNPLGLAELPSQERIDHFSQQKPIKSRVLKGDDFVCYKRLQQGYLYIPMNREKQVEINRTHVKVALRRMGVNVSEMNIIIPSTVSSESTEPFTIKLNIGDIQTVEIPAQIFHWTKIDSVNVTKPPVNHFKVVKVVDWLKKPNY